MTRRVLLKLSGEGLGGGAGKGIGMAEVSTLARQVADAARTGVEIAIVVGGGNIIRGSAFSAANSFVQPATAHHMGMLGTVINGLALQDALESIGCATRLMSAIRMDGVCEPYLRRRAYRHLQKGRVVILACGTGRPFVTTDTAAALYAAEIGASVVLKATRVDGVYNADPERNPHAVRFDALSFQEVLERGLNVMDKAAIGMCMDNRIPIMVFNYLQEGNLARAVAGERVGTMVGGNP